MALKLVTRESSKHIIQAMTSTTNYTATHIAITFIKLDSILVKEVRKATHLAINEQVHY